MSAVTWGRFDASQSKTLPPDYLPPEKARIHVGDLLISRANTLELVGAVVLVDTIPERLFLSDKILRLVIDVDAKKWAFLFLRSTFGRKQIEALATGNQLSMRNISQEALRSIVHPLPPVAEQRRIVTKLEGLSSRLARARTELIKASAISRKLRDQTVRSAFDGTLTARWRRSNVISKGLSDESLAEAYQLVSGSSRQKPIAQISWRPAIDIPPSWRWVSVDQVVAQVQYGTSTKTSDDVDGVPVLRMGNIQRGEVNWKSLKYLPRDHCEFPNLLLKPGDVLFNRTNSFELVGKSAVYKLLDRATSFASYLIRLRPSGIIPELLVAYINSPIGRSWVESVASQQVGQANVNGSKLKGLGIPLPPPEEQHELLRVLSKTFAHVDRLEAEAVRAGALIDRLESAIFAKALRGELIPQDPNDEPASILLDRVRAGRAATPKQKRGRVGA